VVVAEARQQHEDAKNTNERDDLPRPPAERPLSKHRYQRRTRASRCRNDSAISPA
jgi:hypothetical protein